MTDYRKWDTLYDSDEEKQKNKRAEERKRKENAMRAQAAPKPSEADDAMTQDEFAAQYARMVNGNKNLQKRKPYKFPETMEEQRAKCDEAAELKRRGNDFYKKGELVEAAKLYEQAVLKFADWFAVAFATDEEKAMVHGVKLPAHNNLATCSFQLGNLTHAVVHCGEVITHEPDNVKALYRRGACHLRLGNLEQARTDLQRAAKLAPADAAVRTELARLQEKIVEYREKKKSMSNRMLAGADGGMVDEPGSSATGDSEAAAQPPPPLHGSEAERLAALRERRGVGEGEGAEDRLGEEEAAQGEEEEEEQQQQQEEEEEEEEEVVTLPDDGKLEEARDREGAAGAPTPAAEPADAEQALRKRLIELEARLQEAEAAKDAQGAGRAAWQYGAFAGLAVAAVGATAAWVIGQHAS